MHGAAILAALFAATVTIALPSLVALPAAAQVKHGKKEKNRPTDARALLTRMLQAESKVSISGREVTTLTSGRQSEQIVKRHPRRGERTQFLRPAGNLLVDNFRNSWFLSQKDRRLVERESRLNSLRRTTRSVVGRIARGKLSARLLGQDVVAGRTADIVLVSPPEGREGTSRKFWIDRETGVRLKMEELGSQGRVLSSRYFLEINTRPKFAEDDFAPPALPQGFERVVDRRKSFRTVEDAQKLVRFPVRKPRYLPPGYTLRGVSVMEFQGSKVVVQRYGDSLNGVTLFQTNAEVPLNAMRGLRRNRQDAGSREPRIRAWRDGSIAFTLIGNLPPDQMQRIQESLR